MLNRLDTARYLAQQAGLALFLTPSMRAWHWLVGQELPAPRREEVESLLRRYAALLDRDLENARSGIYPKALLFEVPVGRALRELPRLSTEPLRVWRRIRRRGFGDVPDETDRDAYPAYYRRTFHWQTDGWLSRRSADLYDLEVEALFAGAGDVMRRMAIPPLLEGLEPESRPRVLDIGCGTGTFLHKLARCLPTAELYGVDLSPFYLDHARERLPHDRMVSLVAHNAESLPFRDAFFDAASCIFVTHELPAKARRNVIAEAARALRPGGRLVICDAAQLSDSPELEVFLESFPQLYHEPFFRDYLGDDLGEIMTACGLEVISEEPAFLSKVVTARRREH